MTACSCVRSYSALRGVMIFVQPRAFSALTTLEPRKPVPPVTAMRCWRKSSMGVFSYEEWSKHQHVHVVSQEAGDRFLWRVDDRLVLVEGGVQDNRNACLFFERANEHPVFRVRGFAD